MELQTNVSHLIYGEEQPLISRRTILQGLAACALGIPGAFVRTALPDTTNNQDNLCSPNDGDLSTSPVRHVDEGMVALGDLAQAKECTP